MELVKRQLADLKPAEYNSRKALKPGDPEYQRIAASIEEFGYVDPIIINADNTIIGGHQRRTEVIFKWFLRIKNLGINRIKWI